MIRRKHNEVKSPALPKAAVMFGVLLIITGFLYVRLRNGTRIKAPREEEILSETEPVLYRQDDERWGEDRLGDSRFTMRSSGCLVNTRSGACLWYPAGDHRSISSFIVTG